MNFILLFFIIGHVSAENATKDIYNSFYDNDCAWEKVDSTFNAFAFYRLNTIYKHPNLPQGKQTTGQQILEEWRLMYLVSLSVSHHAQFLKERKYEHLFPYHYFW